MTTASGALGSLPVVALRRYDVELMVRTHMLRPYAYKHDICRIFGELRDFGFTK